MSALHARAPQGDGQRAGRVAAAEWARLQAAAPQAVATIHRYLRQLGTFLAPGSVTAAESALRQFARWMVAEAQITAISDVGRDDIEDYNAPPRNPVIAGDIPKKPEPLPKFLDDRDAARLMAAARASTDPRDRLVVELLARTGMFSSGQFGHNGLPAGFSRSVLR